MLPKTTPRDYKMLQRYYKSGINNYSHLFTAQKWGTVEDESQERREESI